LREFTYARFSLTKETCKTIKINPRPILFKKKKVETSQMKTKRDTGKGFKAILARDGA